MTFGILTLTMFNRKSLAIQIYSNRKRDRSTDNSSSSDGRKEFHFADGVLNAIPFLLLAKGSSFVRGQIFPLSGGLSLGGARFTLLSEGSSRCEITKQAFAPVHILGRRDCSLRRIQRAPSHRGRDSNPRQSCPYGAFPVLRLRLENTRRASFRY